MFIEGVRGGAMPPPLSNHVIIAMHDLFLVGVLTLSLLVSASSLDDAFIDVLALSIGHDPYRGNGSGVGPVPRTAVFIANWDEENVIGRMVEGNLSRIDDPDVVLYLGVYPNDTGTLRVAREVAAKYPDRVKLIVNSLDGPTSKGQMLNEMFEQVFSRDDAPDLVVLHDSEDIIDPRSFAVYARFMLRYDFIQVPVFSLNRGRGDLVASTYMDEFAERHTREMIVRNALGASVPSAGVGTGLTREFVQYFLKTHGRVLMPSTVTEDYVLGIEAKRAGFRPIFAAVLTDADEGYDYVATREYFPNTLSASIKQRTRWVYGTSFEATRSLGWQASGWDTYFMFRDRKGVIANFLPAISLALIVLVLLDVIEIGAMPEGMATLFAWSITFNVAMSVVRYVTRIASNYQVYGTTDWFGIALRWPVGIFINMSATFRAWKIYLGESEFASRPIVWSKTVHELPDDFATATR